MATAPTTPPPLTPPTDTPDRGAYSGDVYTNIATAYMDWLAANQGEQVTLSEWLETTAGQVYANALEAEGYAIAAADSAVTASSTANNQGAWSGLTGPASPPFSVTHNGSIWILETPIADITLSEPGVSGDWQENPESASLSVWKERLYPLWISDYGDGNPFPYPQGMIVNHAGQNWISNEDANQEEPGTGGKWSEFRNPAGDAVFSATLAEAVANKRAVEGDRVIISDRGNGLFEYKTGQTPNGDTIIACTGVPGLSLVYKPSNVAIFDSVAQMIATPIETGLRVGRYYYAKGDAGYAECIIKTPAQATADGDVVGKAGTVALANGNLAVIQPEVVGEYTAEQLGGLSQALDEAVDGMTIVLGNADYNIVGKYQLDTVPPASGGVWIGNEVKNLTIRGAGMPELLADESRFVSGTGTIIQGAFINFADGFEAYDLAVDVGDYVVDTLAGGTYMEGFVPGTHKLDTSWDDSESAYINNVHFDNIRVLLKQADIGAETKKHGLLVERIDGGSIGFAETIGGEHGFAYKSRNIVGGNIRAWRQTGDSAIFKTDAFTECGNWLNGSLYVGKVGHAVRTASVLVQAANGTRLKGLTFDYKARNARGLERVYDGSTARLEDVIINSIDIDDVDITAITIPSIADRWHLGTHTIVGAPYGLASENGCLQCSIGNGSVINAGVDGYRLAGDVKHGLISSRNAGGWGVLNQGIIVDPSRISGENNTNGNLSGLFNANGFVAPLNSWVDASFGSKYGADIFDGKFVMRGRLGSGTANVLTNVAAGFRPKTDKRFAVVGHNGTNQVVAYVTVYADGGEASLLGLNDGDVVLDDYTTFNGGLAAGVSLDGVAWEYL